MVSIDRSLAHVGGRGPARACTLRHDGLLMSQIPRQICIKGLMAVSGSCEVLCYLLSSPQGVLTFQSVPLKLQSV